MSTGALGLGHALGNSLAFEVGVFFEQLPVLDQQWPARAGGQRGPIIANWRSALGGHRFLVFHTSSLASQA